jgi:hypothetical protein
MTFVMRADASRLSGPGRIVARWRLQWRGSTTARQEVTPVKRLLIAGAAVVVVVVVIVLATTLGGGGGGSVGY